MSHQGLHQLKLAQAYILLSMTLAALADGSVGYQRAPISIHMCCRYQMEVAHMCTTAYLPTRAELCVSDIAVLPQGIHLA